MESPPGVVVVAKDDWIVRVNAMEALEDAGFAVIEAEHGAEALEAILDRPGRVLALFADIRMPGAIDGLELARRASILIPSLAILVASGHAVPSSSELPSGSLFLPKPYTLWRNPKYIKALLADDPTDLRA